jgi:hypothetical protein
MKTILDLPEDVLRSAQAIAARRQTTLEQLVISSLNQLAESEVKAADRCAALSRLAAGLHLGGQPLTREQAHERQ